MTMHQSAMSKNSARSSNPMRRETYDRIRKEVERLRGPEREEVVQTVRSTARAHGLGDMGAASGMLATLDSRIHDLEMRLSSAQIIDTKNRAGAMDERAMFGSTVVCRINNSSMRRFTLAGPEDTDATGVMISINSPVGRALVGSCVGECVTVKTPSGEMGLEILAINPEE